MRKIVADANVALCLVLHEEDTSLLKRADDALDDAWHVPSVWHLEIANALLNKQKRRLLSFEEINASYEVLQTFPFQTDPYSSTVPVLQNTWQLAKKHQLTMYDASYLELALRLGYPLLTGDEALTRAAKAEQVEVI